MAFCNSHGIPHSVFLEWDPDDQDKALGFEKEQSKACSGCGTRKEEWDLDRFAFVADSWTCPGCEVLAQARDDIPEGRQGVKVFLVERRDFEERQAQALEERKKGRSAN